MSGRLPSSTGSLFHAQMASVPAGQDTECPPVPEECPSAAVHTEQPGPVTGADIFRAAQGWLASWRGLLLQAARCFSIPRVGPHPRSAGGWAMSCRGQRGEPVCSPENVAFASLGLSRDYCALFSPPHRCCCIFLGGIPVCAESPPT